ncbi:unnamed protein product [Phaedon cochleariae]|uniref:Uncharacterized protein n=1 Tax=Phaedon cochleariae TaxID=80249 RepID=A0A9P0GQK5_PHACE|nr:unnamed protein product [Phaedon cochleariae]
MTVGEELGVSQTREDIPLKNGRKATRPYFCNEECFSGSKYMNIAFGTLTFIITLALLIQIYYGDYQVVPHGSVATDSLECSEIGTYVLKEGGNSIDAVIASALCLAVSTPHLTGLDAEGHLLIYNHKAKQPPTVIDFSYPKVLPQTLPRLVFGLAYVHQQYGSLAWKDLVLPASELARKGYVVPKTLVEAITLSKSEDLYGHLEAGQLKTHDDLAKTLDHIASMSENELLDSLKDLREPLTSEATKVKFGNFDVFLPNDNTSAALLAFALKELDSQNNSKLISTKEENIYRLAEITKNIFTTNFSEPLHEGTVSNIAVIDKDENYVSMVTGMYNYFGSGDITSHGYVLDVKSKDKPCSRIALIMKDGNSICGRRIVFGASNFAVALQIISSLLIVKDNATESIEAARFHILPDGTLGIEGTHFPAFNEEVMKYLETLISKPVLLQEPYGSSNIIEKFKDDLSSHSDSRGGGIASRF